MNSVEKRDFDKEAATWDNPPRLQLAADVSKAMVRFLKPDRAMDILDFGCGTGLITLPLAPLVHSITGADSSKGMLEVLTGKAQSQSVDNIRVIHLDIAGSSVITGRYHAVVSSMTLHHVQDLTGLFARFYEVMPPGGLVALADLDEEGGRFHDNNDGVFHFGFDREKLGAVLAQAGFTQVCFTTAAQMKKTDRAGRENVFRVFLMTGRKPSS